MNAWPELALERQLQVAAPEKLATALPAIISLWKFWLAVVGKWSVERSPGSQSKALVHFAKCMVRGGGRANCIGFTSLSAHQKGRQNALINLD